MVADPTAWSWQQLQSRSPTASLGGLCSVLESSRVRKDEPLVRTGGADDSLDGDGRADDGLEAAGGSLWRHCWAATRVIVSHAGKKRSTRIWGVGFSPVTTPVVAGVDGCMSRRRDLRRQRGGMMAWRGGVVAWWCDDYGRKRNRNKPFRVSDLLIIIIIIIIRGWV